MITTRMPNYHDTSHTDLTNLIDMPYGALLSLYQSTLIVKQQPDIDPCINHVLSKPS